jgi:hypothetical protein
MPGVRFEPTTPVFERAKTVHALDRAATVIIDKHITLKKKNTTCSLHAVCKASSYYGQYSHVSLRRMLRSQSVVKETKSHLAILCDACRLKMLVNMQEIRKIHLAVPALVKRY